MSNNASLNHIYRTVWNQALGAMVAVAEIESAGGQSGVTRTRSRAKALQNALSELAWPPGLAVMPLSIAIGFSGLTGFFADAHAQTLPQGGVAIHGTATSNYSQAGKLTVTTTNGAGTAHSATNWNSFSIGAGAKTQINQPNAASMSINRVVTNTPSQLFGTLSSNGRVVLVNQSGIAVGAGALIDTAGFTASAVGMKDADALAGRLRFGGSELGNHTGALTVEGNIIARGGDVVLVAPSIDLAKTAVVEAKDGSVSLVACEKVEITGRGLEGITLEVQAPTDQAINLGSLKGNAVGIFAGTLKHSGLIQAVTADLQGGKVVLRATGDARVDGNAQVLARGDAAGAKGGSVDVLGNRVAVADNALIDVSGQSDGGKIRVGGGFQGKDADVPNATKSFLGPNATLKADAVENGNGGTVIVWADEQTQGHGVIRARGGANAGDGGFVEVSGKQRLAFDARVDTLAPHGKIGTLLLDPDSIEFGATGTPYTGPVAFADGPSTLVLNRSTVNNAASNIFLQANDYINFNLALDIATPGIGITAHAGGTISVSAPIRTKGGAVAMISGHPDAPMGSGDNGAIYLNAPIDTTFSGAVPTGANVSLDARTTDLPGNSLRINGTISAGTSGTVFLIGDDIEQIAGPGITAANLSAVARFNNVLLNNAANNISADVAINSGGSVTFRNSAPNFLVASVGSANGITGAGPVNIVTSGSMDTEQVVSASGALTIVANNGVSFGDDVSASGNLSITTSGGNITSSAAVMASNTLLNAGAGNIALSGSGTKLGGLQVTQAGSLNIQHGTDALVIDNIMAGSIALSSQGGLSSFGATIQAGAGGINIGSTGSSLHLNADGAANLLTPGPISLSAATSLVLGTTTSTGASVTLNAGGPVTQAGPISAIGLAVNAGTSNVTLNNAGNALFGSVAVTGGTVAVTRATGALTLGNVVASNSLNLVVGGAGGSISQGVGTSINAPTASLTAGASNITLSNVGNNVGILSINPGLSPASTGNVTWRNVGPLTLGEVNANNLSVTTGGGAIAQTAALTRVANAATFDTNHAGNVILNNSGNDFGTVSLNVGLGEIRDTNNMTMATITAHGLDLQAAGTLTLPNTAIAVTNDLHLLSGTSLTTLNDLSGANIYLQSNNGDINLGAGTVVQSAGLLNMAANSGSINAANALLSVGTTTSATATNGGSVIMSHPGNSFGSGMFLEGAAIAVRATSAMDVASLTQTLSNQPVQLEAGGLLNLPSTAINTGTANLTLRSGTSLSTEAALSGQNVLLQSGTGDLTLAHAVSAAGDLSLFALGGGNIFQTGPSVSVMGSTVVNAGTHDISLANLSNSFSNISLTGYNITLQAGAGITIGSMSDGASGVSFGNVFIQSSGSLSLPVQDILANGQVTLNSANTLTTQGNIQGTDVILNGGNGLILNHNVAATGFLHLESPNGSVTQGTGNITAPASTIASAAGGISLQSNGNNFFVISATTSAGDITIKDSVADLESFTIAAGGSVAITAQGALLRHSGGTFISSSGAGYNTISLTASSIGTPIAPILVNPGADQVNLTASSGGIVVQQNSGPMALTQYAVSAAGMGQEIRLIGSEELNAHVNVSFSGWNNNTENDDIAILAKGVGADVNVNAVNKAARQFAVGALGTGGAVNLGSDGVQLDAPNGVDVFSISGNVSLFGSVANNQGAIRLTTGDSILGNGFSTVRAVGGAVEATANASLSGPYGAFAPSGTGRVTLDTIDTSGANGMPGNAAAEALGQSGGNVILAVTGGTGTATALSIYAYGGNGAADSGGEGQPGGNGGNVSVNNPNNVMLNLTVDSGGGQGGAGTSSGAKGGKGGDAGMVTLSGNNSLDFQGNIYATGGSGGNAFNDPGAPASGGTAGLAGFVRLDAGGALNFGGATAFNNYPGIGGLDNNGVVGGSSFLEIIMLNGGSISQSAGAAINAANMIVRTTAAAGNIVLTESANLFGEMDGTATGNIEIVGLGGVGDNGMIAGGNLLLTGIASTLLAIQGPLEANNISLVGYRIGLMDDITAFGAFDLNATGNCGCGIDQTAGKINVAGMTTFNSGSDPVNLAQLANDFNVIGGTGGGVQIADANNINLGGISATALTVTAGGTISQIGGIVTIQGMTLGLASFNSLAGAAITLDHAANEMGTLRIINGGAVAVNNNASQPMVLGDVTADSFSLVSSGDVFNQPSATSHYTTTGGDFSVESTAGSIVLGSLGDSAINSGGNILLKAAAGLDLTNAYLNPTSNGTTTLTTSGGLFSALDAVVNVSNGQRWLTYLSNPGGGHVFGPFDPLTLLAGDFRQVNAPFGTAPAQSTGNGSLWSDAPTGISLTVGGSVSKTYDGLTSISTTGAFVDSVSGLLFNETVVDMAGISATLADKNFGSGKAVTFIGSFGPALDANGVPTLGYALPSTATSNIGDVDKASISAVSGITAANKTYDGNTSATLNSTGAAFAGMVGGDNLTVATASGAFADKNFGVGKTVNINAIALGGADAGNYTLASSTASTTANIDKASISAVSGITAANKTYDGNTSATLNSTGAAFAGMVGGDNLTVATASGAFADKNFGVGKTVNINAIALGGADAGNYTLASSTASTTANIDKASISAVSGITAANKTYDGNTSATLNSTGAAFAGMVGGDNLTVATASGAFADKNFGVGKTVNINAIALGGADAGNYTLASSTASTTANIDKASISAVSGITAANKTYDGNTSATLNSTGAAFAGMVGGDNLTVATASGAFADKNFGVGKTVNINAIALGGADAGNYTLASSTASTTANIDKASISAVSGITAANKTYDGNTSATLNSTGAAFAGMVGGDNLTVATASGAFADKNFGVGKTVNINAIALGGADAGNYTLASSTASTTANIDKASISAVSGITAANKTYDGNTSATLNSTGAAFAGMVGGDNLTVATASGAFADKNFGVGKTVNINAIALGGADAGNYTLASSTASTTANIDKASISAVSGITAANKTYDGNTSATLNSTGAAFAGMVGGDNLTVATASGAFADKNFGVGKTVNINAIALGGADAGNYTLASSTASTTANIDKASISAVSGITAANKTYDGNTSATLNSTGAAFAGMVGGDNLTVATASGAFADKNFGVGKTVNINAIALGGADAGNYTLASSTASTTANIDKASISAVSGITAANKTYDGNTSATLNTALASVGGLIGADVVTVAGGTGSFSDKNVGPAKLVLVGGLTLGGPDGGNYQFVGSTTATANISKALLTGVSGITATDKVYDGNTGVTLNTATASIAGLIPGDNVSVISGSGAFSDRHVGTGKLINIVGISLGGPDGGNYSFGSLSSTANATISQRDLSTWTGSVSNQWSNPGNWDALPDGANVRAVVIPSGVVVYDSGVAATQLERIVSSGRLIMNGGALSVSDTLRTSQFGQTGGLLSGAGKLIVESSFSKTGGVIDMGGLVEVTQSSGVLNVGGIRGGNLVFKAEMGGITQGGPLATPGVLYTQATEAIILNNPDNRVSEFLAQTTSGGVELTNIGPLNILGIKTQNGSIETLNTGGIRTTGLVAAPDGRVRFTANSPITIGPDGIIALGDIELIATNLTSAGNMLINGNLISTGGSISLDAANNLTQNASLAAAGAITAQAGGLITFGPVAISSGSPVRYVGAAGAVANPPASLSELISRNSGGGTGGGLLDEFLSRFEKAIDKQQNKSDDETLKKKKQGDVVVEGEICRP